MPDLDDVLVAVGLVGQQFVGSGAHAIPGVDDAEPNVLGARVVGMRGFLHTDPATTRAALAALIPHLTLTPTGATA